MNDTNKLFLIREMNDKFNELKEKFERSLLTFKYCFRDNELVYKYLDDLSNRMDSLFLFFNQDKFNIYSEDKLLNNFNTYVEFLKKVEKKKVYDYYYCWQNISHWIEKTRNNTNAQKLFLDFEDSLIKDFKKSIASSNSQELLGFIRGIRGLSYLENKDFKEKIVLFLNEEIDAYFYEFLSNKKYYDISGLYFELSDLNLEKTITKISSICLDYFLSEINKISLDLNSSNINTDFFFDFEKNLKIFFGYCLYTKNGPSYIKKLDLALAEKLKAGFLLKFEDQKNNQISEFVYLVCHVLFFNFRLSKSADAIGIFLNNKENFRRFTLKSRGNLLEHVEKVESLWEFSKYFYEDYSLKDIFVLVTYKNSIATKRVDFLLSQKQFKNITSIVFEIKQIRMKSCRTFYRNYVLQILEKRVIDCLKKSSSETFNDIMTGCLSEDYFYGNKKFFIKKAESFL